MSNSKQIYMGALMKCSFGVAPSALNVITFNREKSQYSKMPAANIMDNKAFLNVPSFGMCMSPINPLVASQTAAAQGVLTPAPCIPSTSVPWSRSGSLALVDNAPALEEGCSLHCDCGGRIDLISNQNKF